MNHYYDLGGVRSLNSIHNATDDISIAIGQALDCMYTKGKIGIRMVLITIVR